MNRYREENTTRFLRELVQVYGVSNDDVKLEAMDQVVIAQDIPLCGTSRAHNA